MVVNDDTVPFQLVHSEINKNWLLVAMKTNPKKIYTLLHCYLIPMYLLNISYLNFCTNVDIVFSQDHD